MLVAAALLVLAAAQPARAHTPCFSRLFNFGDSLSDTGNYRFIFPNDTNEPVLPYGETFFNRSTGRFSNGRLILDFIGTRHKPPSPGPMNSLAIVVLILKSGSGSTGAAVRAAVLERAERQGLRARRQLRRWRRHGAQPGILRGE
jgi:hypothetical protein